MENFTHTHTLYFDDIQYPNLLFAVLRCSLTNVHTNSIWPLWPLFIFNSTLSLNCVAHIHMVWGYLHKLVIVLEMTTQRKTTCFSFNSYQLPIALQKRIRVHVLLSHSLALMLKGSRACSCAGHHRWAIPWMPASVMAGIHCFAWFPLSTIS